MRVAVEYCVTWQREGLRRKTKRYARLSSAQRFVLFLGPEPWRATGDDPDKLCCSGVECGCGGLTTRERLLEERRDMPPVTHVHIFSREVGPWILAEPLP